MADLEFMYYDRFRNEYTLDKDMLAPPERYLSAYKGKQHYVETYCIGIKQLQVAYTEDDLKHDRVNLIRYAAAKDHNFPITEAMLFRCVIPAEKYEEYYNMFCKEVEDERRKKDEG